MVIGIGLAVIGILVISSLIRGATSAPPAPTPIPPITTHVLITTHDISIRSLLRPEDLTTVELPVELVPFNAMSAIDDAVDRITMIPLVSGEMLLDHHLADPTNINKDLAFVIEDEQVLMAFPSTDLMSEINILQPGDLVDILASIEQPVLPGEAGITGVTGDEDKPEDVLFTFNALQHVTISAIVVEILPQRSGTSSSSTAGARTVSADGTPEPTPTPAPSQIETQAILLALNPQDALVLKHIMDKNGIIDIVLRAPTSVQRYELNPVTSEYLRDRYELVISR